MQAGSNSAFLFSKNAMEEAKRVTGQDRLFGINQVRTSSIDRFSRIIDVRDGRRS